MILAEAFYNTIEFYVMAAVVAAAVVGFCVKPAASGPVMTHLLAGDVGAEEDPGCAPAVEFECRDDGSVVLRRRGVTGIGPDGYVSLAVTVKGFDVTVEERLTPGASGHDQPVEARFVLDFMGAERYHLRYESDSEGLFAVLTLANRPGVRITRELRR